MYIADWDTFAEQAEALYRSDPLRVRYVLKYRHCDGKAVLKVTDDKTVTIAADQRGVARHLPPVTLTVYRLQALQFKTDQIADVKKIEKLNLLFFSLMAQGSDAEGEHPVCLYFVWHCTQCHLIVCQHAHLSSCVMATAECVYSCHSACGGAK